MPLSIIATAPLRPFSAAAIAMSGRALAAAKIFDAAAARADYHYCHAGDASGFGVRGRRADDADLSEF